MQREDDQFPRVPSHKETSSLATDIPFIFPRPVTVTTSLHSAARDRKKGTTRPSAAAATSADTRPSP